VLFNFSKIYLFTYQPWCILETFKTFLCTQCKWTVFTTKLRKSINWSVPVQI